MLLPEEKTYGRNSKKSDKPFLAARIPASLNQAIESHVESTGESKTDIIINALAAYLGWSEEKITKTSTSDRISSLEKRIQELEETVYKPQQTSLLDIMPLRAQNTSIIIKNDNEVDNEARDIDNTLENDDNSFDKEEWLTTKEAYDKYCQEMAYNTFRKLSPKQISERFDLETDPSKRKVGSNSCRWIKKR